MYNYLQNQSHTISSSSFQEVGVGISLIGLTSPHICACLKPWPSFPTSYGMVILVFGDFS